MSVLTLSTNMITSDHPLYFLSARLTDVPPDNFERITVPLNVETEIGLVSSMWATLHSTECLVTYKKNRVVFWRRKLPKSYRDEELVRQFVRTR